MGAGISYKDCWAKTDAEGRPALGVYCHGLNAFAVGERVAERLGATAFAGLHLLPWGCAVHDIGKISPGFLVKSEAWLTEFSLAERAGAEQWANGAANCASHGTLTGNFIATQNSFRLTPTDRASKFTRLIAGHHGRIPPIGLIRRPPQAAPASKEFATQRVECWEAIASTCNIDQTLGIDSLPRADAHLFAIAGWVAVCDWIASAFPLNLEYRTTPTSLKQARRRAEEAINTIGGFSATPKRGTLSFAELFFKPSPRPLQSELFDACSARGLYIVEAAMGEGKTEAALWASQRLIASGKARGLYFALPTQVTGDRIFADRVRPFIEAGFEVEHLPDALRLVHSAAWLRARPLAYG